MTTTKRSAVPMVLLTILSLLAVGAALLGLTTGPSMASIDLRNAEAQTAAVSTFSFHLYDDQPEIVGRIQTTAHSLMGTWQAPDRVRITTLPTDGHKASTEVVVGSAISSPHNSGVRFPKSLAQAFSDPFITSQVPETELPPLGLITTAQNVVQKGDTFTFDLPPFDLGFGWVAYAPLSGGAQAFSFKSGLVSRNTKVSVTVRDGLIVSLSLPHGVDGRRIRICGPQVWKLSSFGTAPAVN